MLKTADFDYYLPKELIAQNPSEKRDHSRLMVLNRKNQTIEHRYFYQILDYLQSGDLLVLNDTKVIPANLVGVKEGVRLPPACQSGRDGQGGAKIEVLLTSNRKLVTAERKQIWECLVKPGKRLKVGSRIIFAEGELIGKVLEKKENGEQIIEFESQEDFWKILKKWGEIPLPPYIKMTNDLMTNDELRKRYQTTYGRNPGASAAPTAGLHFTPELLQKIEAKGVKIAYLTLHTGLATFRPVWTEEVEDHKMYAECFEVSFETIRAIKKAQRVIAVGTTSVRALESMDKKGDREGLGGETNLFIYPGHKFKMVDAVITNFHWPRSTLIILVSAFAGREFILQAYQEAIQKRYRFYSFGDAMLIL